MLRLHALVSLSLAVSLLLLAPCARAASPIAHVFLIAGQSNSVGYNTDGATGEDQSYPNILQLSCCNGTVTLPDDQCTFDIASDPLLHYCDADFRSAKTIGFGMSFARQFAQSMAWNDIIVLVPAGRSGTGFHDNTWTAYKGPGFIEAAQRTQRAFSLLTTLYKQYLPVFAGVAWHQGEHDASDNSAGYFSTTENYIYNDMTPMINAFRDRQLLNFTRATLPFVCGNMLPSWTTNTSMIGNMTHAAQRDGVYRAIMQIPQIIPYTAEAPSFGLIGDPVYLSGLDNEVIHFSASSARILGRRYFAALQAAIYNEPDLRKSSSSLMTRRYEMKHLALSVASHVQQDDWLHGVHLSTEKRSSF